MRIVLATPLYPPQIGGPATHARFVERVLAQAGHEVFTVPFSAVAHLPPGIRHIRYALRLWQVARTAHRIYALDAVSVGLPAAVVSWRTRKPLILRVAGDFAWEQGVQRCGVSADLDTFVSGGWYGIRVWLWRLIQRYVSSCAMRIVVPRQYFAGIVRAWGVEQQKIVVCYSAFAFSPGEPPKLIERPMHILCAARLVPWKGITKLIDIFIQVRSRVPNVQLCIAGDGPERNTIEAYIAGKEISESVTMYGQLSTEVLNTHLRSARVFVLPTAYEGFSHVLLEAINAGVPIVTTPVGGNPELIEDGDTGILISLADESPWVNAVAKVLADTAYAQGLADAARVRAQSHFAESVVTPALIDAVVL
jgi:glycosyltransferase involved in cell wall biosynthesis